MLFLIQRTLIKKQAGREKIMVGGKGRKDGIMEGREEKNSCPRVLRIINNLHYRLSAAYCQKRDNSWTANGTDDSFTHGETSAAVFIQKASCPPVPTVFNHFSPLLVVAMKGEGDRCPQTD